MEVKLRAVASSGTWYDYKMAVVGTLIDYGMYIRKHEEDFVIFRSDVDHTKHESIVKKIPKADFTWKEFYLIYLANLIRKELE